jgi:hypothetical protein
MAVIIARQKVRNTGSVRAWEKYQHDTPDLLRELGFATKVNDPLPGPNGVVHRVDVSARITVVGVPVLWIVECKLWNSRVPKEKVSALKDIVNDLAADRGLLMSEKWFQSGAVNLAAAKNITLSSLADLRSNAAEQLITSRVTRAELRLLRLIHRVTRDLRTFGPAVPPPADLNNAECEKWTRENPNGNFTLDWWAQYQRPRLKAWLAMRPYSGKALTPRFIECAADLSTAWRKSCVPYLAHDISTVTWDQVEEFPNEVARIKQTKVPSPVFTSKFCHFLLPRIFPVVDNDAVGGGWRTYGAYYKFVQNEWHETDPVVRSDLIAALKEEIGKDRISSEFPTVTTIVELRLIGRRHPRTMK